MATLSPLPAEPFARPGNPRMSVRAVDAVATQVAVIAGTTQFLRSPGAFTSAPGPHDARSSCCSADAFRWGEAWELGTAAFWVEQALENPTPPGGHRLGRSLREELAACILGGFGVPGAIGNAAFVGLRSAGLLDVKVTNDTEAASWVKAMSAVLAAPMPVGSGRRVRYRFHQQRPRRLVDSLRRLAAWEAAEGPGLGSLHDVELRDRLMTLPGVGPKTASWVVRNFRDSNEVAILDIHIQRAGVSAGVFCSDWKLPRDYKVFEEAFLAWAAHGGVSAADLDAVIWHLLSTLGRHAPSLLRPGTKASESMPARTDVGIPPLALAAP